MLFDLAPHGVQVHGLFDNCWNMSVVESGSIDGAHTRVIVRSFTTLDRLQERDSMFLECDDVVNPNPSHSYKSLTVPRSSCRTLSIASVKPSTDLRS